MHRFLRRAAALLLYLLATTALAQAQVDQAQVHVAYQAIPGTDTGWPDIARLDYAQRQALSEAVARDIVPGVLRAVGADEAATRTAIVPGGYRLRTDPSLVTSFATAGDAAVDSADRFAAAIAYVLRQDAVLVFAAEARGDSVTVRVRLDQPCLTPQAAQAFFRHAATVAAGLGGGYTAFDCEMWFVNLRDDGGAPYSSLDDTAFAQALAMAAARFAPPATIAGTFRSRTALVGVGWPQSAGGRLHVERLAALPAEALSQLDLLSYRFADRLRAAMR